jgi:hypothetical protein
MKNHQPASPRAVANEDVDTWDEIPDEMLSSSSSAPPQHFMFSGHDPGGAWRWACPKEFLTGALWRAQKRGRELLLGETITTNKNVVLIGTGESLFQYDNDVFMLVAHKGRNGGPISFRVRDFIVELRGEGKGKKTRGHAAAGRPIDSVGGASAVSALRSIVRLANFHVNLSVKDKMGSFAYGYIGKLIDEATISLDGQHMPLNDAMTTRSGVSEMVLHITLNPAMSALFEKKRCVFFIPSMRRKFSASPLALWMYGFVRANSRPIDLPLSYFREKSGSSSSPGEFRRLMKAARKRLRTSKLIYSSRMDQGRLHFVMKKPVRPDKGASSINPSVRRSDSRASAGEADDNPVDARGAAQQTSFEFDS